MCTQGLNLFRVLMVFLKPVLPGIAERAEAFLGAPVARWRDIDGPLVGTTIAGYEALATRVDPGALQKLVETPMTVEEKPPAATGPASISAASAMRPRRR